MGYTLSELSLYCASLRRDRVYPKFGRISESKWKFKKMANECVYRPRGYPTMPLTCPHSFGKFALISNLSKNGPNFGHFRVRIGDEAEFRKSEKNWSGANLPEANGAKTSSLAPNSKNFLKWELFPLFKIETIRPNSDRISDSGQKFNLIFVFAVRRRYVGKKSLSNSVAPCRFYGISKIEICTCNVKL